MTQTTGTETPITNPSPNIPAALDGALAVYREREIQLINEIAATLAELGEVAASRATGRTGPGEVTIFKSLGMAVEDVVAARLAVERARAAGLGQSFDLA